MPIAFLLSNWKTLLALAAAAVLGLMLLITKLELANLKAAVAQQKAEAAQLLADETAKVRDLEAKAAATNAELETTRHESELQAADADRTVRAALARVRQQRCGNGGQDPVRRGAGAGGIENPATGSDAELAEGTIDDFTAQCARGANILAARVRECQSWAMTIGKP